MTKKLVEKLLSAPWWSGIGVILAIALPLSVYVYKNTIGLPVSQFEADLLRLVGKDEIVVKNGETLELKSEQAVLESSKITLEANATLILPDDASAVSIYAIDAEFNAKSIILSRKSLHNDGDSGEQGKIDGRECVNGGNGERGTEGSNGRSASSISLNFVNLVLNGELKIIAAGSDGGAGGRGGDGAEGGGASRGKKCSGGSGGNGGNGGPGGDGGDGGVVVFNFVNVYPETGRAAEAASLRQLIVLENGPGLGGDGGDGGEPGDGGKARGPYVRSYGAQPGGSDGVKGSDGKDGDDGDDGGAINLIKIGANETMKL